ncbi:MAG TPA: YtxH domain-containing protein, partial [Longimicrobium sp.]|nr:YtxH domain-containing protein [Longimicrobium sp.]
MRQDEEEYEVVFEERGGFGTFLLGALFGAGVALLLAPRSGRETQAELARALGGVREMAGGPVDGTRQSVAGWVDRTRGRVTGRLDEVRAAVDDRLDRVRGAVDEGRMAATQARVELRRRVDEAKARASAGRRASAPAA